MTKFLSIKELLPDDFTDDASSLSAWRMTAATWWAISRILHGALWLAVIAYYFYFWSTTLTSSDRFGLAPRS
jgi:hypothetical protein